MAMGKHRLPFAEILKEFSRARGTLGGTQYHNTV